MSSQQTTLVLGDYQSTRIVDQICSPFKITIWNPENLKGLLEDRVKEVAQVNSHRLLDTSQNIIPQLIIIDEPINARDKNVQNLFRVGRHLFLHILVLDAFGGAAWHLSMTQFDRIFLFNFTYRHLKVDRIFKNYLLPSEPNLKFGHCLLRSFHWGGFPEDIVPWQRYWTPELHYTFNDAVKERVLLLLRGRLDCNSSLSQMDHHTIMQILRFGGGLDR
jgi:hypothetical protein